MAGVAIETRTRVGSEVVLRQHPFSLSIMDYLAVVRGLTCFLGSGCQESTLPPGKEALGFRRADRGLPHY